MPLWQKTVVLIVISTCESKKTTDTDYLNAFENEIIHLLTIY